MPPPITQATTFQKLEWNGTYMSCKTVLYTTEYIIKNAEYYTLVKEVQEKKKQTVC